MAGILSMLSGLVRDAGPGVVAARAGYNQGQDTKAQRADAAEQRRQTALRQAMQDERDTEWHTLRMQTGRAALEPKPVEDEWRVVPDAETPTVYNPRTGETKPLAGVRRRRLASELDTGGSWHALPGSDGTLYNSRTARTMRVGSTETPGTGGNGAAHTPRSPKELQRMEKQVGMVTQQLRDTQNELKSATESVMPGMEDDATTQRTADLRARADSLTGVRDSIVSEFMGNAVRRGAPTITMPPALVMPEAAERVPKAPDNLSPLQADYDAAAAAFEQAMARAGTDPAKQRAARREYEAVLAAIAGAEQRTRTGR